MDEKFEDVVEEVAAGMDPRRKILQPTPSGVRRQVVGAYDFVKIIEKIANKGVEMVNNDDGDREDDVPLDEFPWELLQTIFEEEENDQLEQSNDQLFSSSEQTVSSSSGSSSESD